jgi:hypothetical protein
MSRITASIEEAHEDMLGEIRDGSGYRVMLRRCDVRLIS